MSTYIYTNQHQLRAAFFAQCEKQGESTRGKKTRFDLVMHIAFICWVSALQRRRMISEALAKRAVLYPSKGLIF